RALISRFDSNIVYDHVYIDLDDTLLREDGVAPLMAAFLFQCRNKRKKLHLLTRHTEDVERTLTKYALCGLFDTVTVVEPGTSKAAVISHQDAIFIDDSHAERKEVREATGIPVFSPDAVECLLDWRQ
ncbi:MAG TPA: carbamoylphosphate synthase large subunit short form, partial [Candidatus Hydrogenedentes bacterium]|nr:carbamoylphosphate synthase large subunit short form [Candidatus Hydrogenedentota bacterium]